MAEKNNSSKPNFSARIAPEIKADWIVFVDGLRETYPNATKGDIAGAALLAMMASSDEEQVEWVKGARVYGIGTPKPGIGSIGNGL